MARFGVIFAAHNAQPHLATALQPWIDARAASLGGHTLTICAVSVPFEGFPLSPPDDTLAVLARHAAANEIDHVIVSDAPMKETEARGAALRWLTDRALAADYVWQVDGSDELYTAAHIEAILRFVDAHPLVGWFRLSLRNAVFDTRTFLVEPFTPTRIHRVRIGPYVARSFSDDNDVAYHGTVTRDIRPQAAFASMTVPKTVAWVPHLSWLNDGPNGRSHRKILYQESRAWNPTFAWDDTKGGLIWRDPTRAPETATDP